MRILLFILFFLVIDWYSFQAIRTLTQSWNTTLKTVIYTLFWVIPIFSIAFLVAVTQSDTTTWNKYWFTFGRTFIFIAYLSKMLIAPFLLIDDVRRLVLYIMSKASEGTAFNASRSRFLSQAGLLIGSIPFLSLTYGIIRNPYRYKLFHSEVPIKGLPAELEGLRIVQISDIHSGSFTLKEPVKNAIDLINAQQPDLVFFTGDMVNTVADEMDDYKDVFNKIEAKYGVYSVLGNHDYGDYYRWPNQEAKKANLDKLFQTHKDLGWNLLLNAHELLDINDQKVAVIGVENYSAHPRFPKYGDLAKAYNGTEAAQLKLLLSHDPSHWKDQVTTDYKDIDITFSGHTHGMQFGIEIPGWFKWSPIKYVYKQWAGLYQQEGQYLYVNRGLGFLGYPGRVGILPEVTFLELKSA
ncbi:MAG: metallophosphoesterase [Bacteroidota bacterium]